MIRELEDSSETIKENEVTVTDPGLPRTFLVLVLKIPHPGKPLSPEQTG